MCCCNKRKRIFEKKEESLMKKFWLFLVSLLVMAFACMAFADAPAPIAATGLPAVTSFSAFLASLPLPAVSATGIFVVELLAKLIPTANPQGWLVWIGSILNKASVVLSQLASAVTQLDNVVGAVIPQNIAPVVAVATAAVKSS